MCVDCQWTAFRRAQAQINEEIRNSAWMKAEVKAWAERSALLARLRSDRRAEALALATPPWADRNKIKAVYAEARARTLADGIQYHVDHIWPLINAEFCGLHIHTNLRVIPASENCAKSNKRPALD